jgi:hypothetical protein
MGRRPSGKRLPPVTAEEAKRLIDLVDEAIYEFKGNVDHLEAAIGMLLVGRVVGWKVLLLVHNKRTIRKYEEILGNIDIRQFLPEETKVSDRSLAYRAVQTLGNFWKAVSGEVQIPDRREFNKPG